MVPDWRPNRPPRLGPCAHALLEQGCARSSGTAPRRGSRAARSSRLLDRCRPHTVCRCARHMTVRAARADSHRSALPSSPVDH